MVVCNNYCLFFLLSDSFLHGTIPVILDRIVRSSREQFCDLSPSVSKPSMFPQDCVVLFGAPRILSDVRVQVVVPALSALFPNPTRQALCDLRPLFGSKFFDKLDNFLIIFFSPRPFDNTFLWGFCPSFHMRHLKFSVASKGDVREGKNQNTKPSKLHADSYGKTG